VIAEPFPVGAGVIGRPVLGSSFLCASVIRVLGYKCGEDPSICLTLGAGGLVGRSGFFALAQRSPGPH
jgi:hypothetical protein